MTTSALDLLLSRLDLEPDPTRSQVWVGTAGSGSLNRSQRLFGGLIVGQVLVAAGRSQPERRIHSLQQMFLRAGNVIDPLMYRVTPLFEGGVHAASVVAVEQAGEIISHAQVGFTRGRDGQPDIDEVATDGLIPPDGAADREVLRSNLQPGQSAPIEMRVVESQQRDTTPALDIWCRAGGDPGDDPLKHLGLLGYASDRGMLSTAGKMLGDPPNLQASTVNHSIWVHRPVDLRAWHVHRVLVRTMTDGRALLDGSMHGPDGSLVATTRQEGAVRLR